jgi:hypothetical protein
MLRHSPAIVKRLYAVNSQNQRRQISSLIACLHDCASQFEVKDARSAPPSAAAF